ncbi:hypothetical protein HPB50_005922 [Hyalomma asiaticum]|uniref:Uncharacterized protein n=1 Tax=Hyalomma asiaticum TaxID=266040 RepID=A0ACB7T1F6_HYAAI|nr:hypothetical protein HPB50_005922 [Hyalomma asiaticum]
MNGWVDGSTRVPVDLRTALALQRSALSGAEEPPPPYTPGYYDPTTGLPYQAPPGGGDCWAGSSVRQRVAPSCPSGPVLVRGVRSPPPPVPQSTPSPRPHLPAGVERGASLWPSPPWGVSPEDEERLAGAMGAVRIG